MPPPPLPAPLPRAPARRRPAADPACAGCALLGAFRALRRAGLDLQGGAGCDPAARDALAAAPGRWAAVAGARAALAGAPDLVSGAARAGARLLVVADDRRAAPAGAVEAALRAGGGRAVPVDPADLAATEAAVRAASEAGDGRVALVALAACARGAPRSAPFAVAPSRCNRCGACLALGCAAISDPGLEAMAIDPGVCSGCGLCAPLCRGRAIAVAG